MPQNRCTGMVNFEHYLITYVIFPVRHQSVILVGSCFSRRTPPMVKTTFKLNLNPNFKAEVLKAAQEKLNDAFAPAKVEIVTDKPKNSTE
jgi:hypothetical protein